MNSFDDNDVLDDEMDDMTESDHSLSPVQAMERPMEYHSDLLQEGHLGEESNCLQELQNSMNSLEQPLSLEGSLFCRRGRGSAGPTCLLWKKRFVFLNFLDGGSVTVYKETPEGASFLSRRHNPDQTALQTTVYTKLHRRLSGSVNMMPLQNVRSKVDIHIPAQLPWIVKDVENDSSSFVIELPYEVMMVEALNVSTKSGNASSTSGESPSLGAAAEADDEPEELAAQLDQTMERTIHSQQPQEESLSSSSHHHSSRFPSIIYQGDVWDRLLHNAHSKGKPLRIHFRCNKGSHEKALWLKAFSRLKRLSLEVRQRKRSILGSLHIGGTTPKLVRFRNEHHETFARDARQLDLVDQVLEDETEYEPTEILRYPPNDVEQLVRGDTPETMKDREYRVQPAYAYPHRWMTRREMREEMILPSETFHDLRVPGNTQKEIGALRVEVLQCLGLPKLDRTSDTDAIVYLVCGAYAFTTDVIPNRANPMWLRKSRRACEFPIYHAYARLYVGVFDDDKNRVKDEFAGRVVIDLARLRPRSTYDVTLPLRLSTHVYSRRRRGAVRLRFSITWKNERDALLSYLPKRIKIPLPQNSKPNLDVTVMCADQKAFRNIAITVHGAHLPGKFTFQQMRATIREINFTRKYIFTSIRQWVRTTRHWEVPAMSAFVFLAWMHCVYANSFSLVPAFIVSYFCLILMQNYAKYGIDRPNQRGFIPPSWEELFLALTRGFQSDYHAIEPMDLGHAPAPFSRRSAYAPDITSKFHFSVKTHEPMGKPLFRALGFLNDQDGEFVSPEDDHLEFPFADGSLYPKFTVKECLVGRRGEQASGDGGSGTKDLKSGSVCGSGSGRRRARSFDVLDTLQLAPTGNGEIRMIPQMPRFISDVVDIQDIMRKDSSGLNDVDEEEGNFAAARAVVHSGRKASRAVVHSGKKAVSKTASTISKTATGLTKAATEVTERTGLHHVVNPITNSITTGMTHMTSGMVHVTSGMSQGVADSVAHVTKGVGHVTNGVSQVMGDVAGYTIKRSISTESDSALRCEALVHRFSEEDDTCHEGGDDDTARAVGSVNPTSGQLPSEQPVVWQDQNVDVEGPNTGKKLTDDLAEVKDKMHDMTWHLFDDKLYTIKNPEAIYFGQGKKSEKQRRKTEVKKGIEKLMRVGQYSHNNPFVARVGLYVEPIVGSAYSILALFRAGFNVMTWRDPFFTFWLSFFSGLLAIILFFFPWRIFLFFLGIFLVGPQNWVIRKLRERGHLPPLPIPGQKKPEADGLLQTGLPEGQMVFTSDHRQPGNKMPGTSSVDPREVHHVVVPYSPLMYQRFYDWPPEPQYAQVTSVGTRAHAFVKSPSRLQRSELSRARSDTSSSFRKRFQRHRGRSYSADSTRSKLSQSSWTWRSTTLSSDEWNSALK